MVIFGISPLSHNFNPDSRHDFALRSRTPSFNPVIPTQTFVLSLSRGLFLASRAYFWIPNLNPILLWNPESRASNNGDPGSRKTYRDPLHSCAFQLIDKCCSSGCSASCNLLNGIEPISLLPQQSGKMEWYTIQHLLINKCETDCATGAMAHVLYLTIIPRVRVGYE